MRGARCRASPGESGGELGAALAAARGEDGAVQGMLELAGVPYVGAGNYSVKVTAYGEPDTPAEVKA